MWMFIWVIDHARDRQGHPGLGGFLVHFSFQGGKGFFFLVPIFTFYFMGEAGLQSPFWFCFCFSFHPGQRRQVSKENVLLFHFIQDGGDEGTFASVHFFISSWMEGRGGDKFFHFFASVHFSFHPGWRERQPSNYLTSYSGVKSTCPSKYICSGKNVIKLAVFPPFHTFFPLSYFHSFWPHAINH